MRTLTHLQVLDLQETRLTDNGLSALGGLIHLRSLDVGSTQVSDAGLAHLAGLTKLERRVKNYWSSAVRTATKCPGQPTTAGHVRIVWSGQGRVPHETERARGR